MTLLSDKQADLLKRRQAATFIPQVLDNRRDPPRIAREIEQLRKLIKKAGTSALTVRLDLTPAMLEAMQFFAFKKNRKVSEPWVEKMQVIIRDDRYCPEVMPFHFDWEGDFRNGQHRAQAAINEGITLFDHEVKFGMDPKDFEAFDVGNKRNAVQFMQIAGVKQPAPIAAVVRLMYRTDPLHRGASLDEQGVLLEGMKIDDEVMHRALLVAVKLRRRHGVVVSSAALAYRMIALDSPHSDRVDEFFDRVTLGDHLPTGSPILRLHRKLVATKPGAARKVSQYLTQAQHCAWLIETWKAWLTGTSPKDMLSWDSAVELPGFDDLPARLPKVAPRGRTPMMRQPPQVRLVV